MPSGSGQADGSAKCAVNRRERNASLGSGGEDVEGITGMGGLQQERVVEVDEPKGDGVGVGYGGSNEWGHVT